MKFNSIQNDFSAGELSRNIRGRTNIEEYFKGAAEMTNFIPLRTGGATFRPGTHIRGGEFSFLPAGIVLEFSPRDNEVYTLVLQPGENSGITPIANDDASIATITYPTGGYIWNTRPDFTTSGGAYSPTTDQIREIVDSLQYAQSGDILIIVDGTGVMAPIVVARTSLNNLIVDSLIWPTINNPATGTPYLFMPDYKMRVPFRDTNINTNIRFKPSATSGTITISAENASAAALNYFTGDPIGMRIKITHASVTGSAYVTAKISDSSVTAVVDVNFGATTASSNHEVSVWNAKDGYPRSVAFYEQRLIFGGNKSFPDTIWCSLTGNIYHFMQRRYVQDASTDTTGLGFFGTAKASDPFSFIPASVGANAIQWLFPTDQLLCGTLETEFAISGGTDNGFSSTTFFIKPISGHGSSKVQPVKVGGSVLFVSVEGKRVLEIPKRLAEYSAATDVTILAEGLVDKAIDQVVEDSGDVIRIRNKITRLAWDETENVLWALVKNGGIVETNGDGPSALMSLTLDKTAKTMGWAKHAFAGNPFISSISMVKDTSNPGMSRLHMFTYRENATAYSLEYMSYRCVYDSLFTGDPTVSGRNSIYLDGATFASSTTNPLDGTRGTVTTGEIELAGTQTDAFPTGTSYAVFEIVDGIGSYIGDFVEAAGVITDDAFVTTKTYMIGVIYEGIVKTMPIEAGAQFGVAQGSSRRSHTVVLGLDRALGGGYKASLAVDYYNILQTTDGNTSSLYTGEKELSLNASPNDHQTIMRQTKPYPITILWLLHKGYTYDV